MYPLLEHGALCFILLSNDVLPSYDAWVDFYCPMGYSWSWWYDCIFYFWCCPTMPSILTQTWGAPAVGCCNMFMVRLWWVARVTDA
jgi:hypothetical protein